MLTIQFISYDLNLRKNFRQRYKSGYKVHCPGSIRGIIKGVKSSAVDITVIDLLHQKIRDEFLTSVGDIGKVLWSGLVYHACDIHKYSKRILDYTSLLLILPQDSTDNFLDQVFRLPIQDHLWWNIDSNKKAFLLALDVFLSRNIEFLRIKRENFVMQAELNSMAPVNRIPILSPSINPFAQEKDTPPLSFLLGESKAIQICRDQVKNASKNNVSTVLFGEKGFEQEFIAYYIHSISRRSGKNFKLVDFGNVPQKLYDSAIFEEILFALNNQDIYPKPWLEKNIATIFMHRAEFLSWEQQTVLMKFLQSLEIWNRKKKFKVQILFSITKDPKELLDTGIFRQDLLNKISLRVVRIPSIFERDYDIILILDQYFSWYRQKYQKQINISPKLKLEIADYFLKKNVDEIYSSLEKWLSLSKQGIDDVEAFRIIRKQMPSAFKIKDDQRLNSSFLREKENQDIQDLFNNSSLTNTFQPELEKIEKMYIQYVLNLQERNMAKVSRTLGYIT